VDASRDWSNIRPIATPAATRNRGLLLHPIHSRNPFEESFAQLLRTIRLGAVPVGESLPSERDLAESLGVSRTTVREALRALEHAGYVTTRRGRFGGTFVVRQEIEHTAQERKRLLGEELDETLDVRTAVEPGATALAATRVQDGQLEDMRHLVDAMRASEGTDFLRLNCQLHVAVARASGSEQLATLVTDLELRVMDALLAAPRLERSVEHSHQQHEAIVSALAAGDPEAARAAMEEHLAGSDVILRALTPNRKRRTG
jgi:DNA-binding FadR family transcriptional regulator